MDTQLKAYNALRHCPACGKTLETDPVSGYKTCFLHGNFILSDEDGVIFWKFTQNLIVRP